MKRGMMIGLTMAVLSGCGGVGGYSVQTIGQMKQSEFKATYFSDNPPSLVSQCMMGKLYTYLDESGKGPYMELFEKEFGTTKTISLRTAPNAATRLYGLSTEMLALIENLVHEKDGTRSTIWTSPYHLSSQDFLDTITNTVKVCL